jgi:hypothetical protein
MLKTVTNSINASQIQTPITLPGDVTLSTGNLVIGTAGKGIDFTQDPNPAGMTSELLADYEEGTWTIGLTFGGASTGITFDGQDAFYTKIGRFVHVSGRFSLSSKGSATGGAVITGLPFAINSTNGARPAGIVAWYVNMVGANGFTLLGDGGGDTKASLYIPGALAGNGANDTNFTNTSTMYFSYTYIV